MAPAQQSTAKLQEKPAITAADFMKQAQEYAKENIKNTNQREAFLKHLSNVTEKVYSKNAETPSKENSNPVASKSNNAAKQDVQQESGHER